MEQVRTLWVALGLRRQIIIACASLAMFAAVLLLSRIATTPSSAMLFSGLDGAAAGEVVAALEQRGVNYSVKGSAIFVPAPQRDELRMALAADGLPANSAGGYEILDTLSGFGTTSQMFDAAYWRALEGELARTILSSPQVRTARVHIGRETGSGLRRQEARTAAVTVTGATRSVTSAQAKALKYLVGSAVSGLTPDKVSVIDGTTGTVFADDPAESGGNSTGDRAQALKRSVERLLEARVGPGKVAVEVAVEFVHDTELITERRIDPDSRIAISTETEENALDSTEPTPGVTVASNLPSGDVAAGTAGRSQNNQVRERTNFEVSETQRELRRAPGSIRRLSVAVLVDGLETVQQDGSVVTSARSDEEIADLKELVASAVGFDAGRGDVITIRSMDFEPVVGEGTEAQAGFLDDLHIDAMLIFQLLLLSGVILALGFGVVRPIIARATELPPPRPSLAAPDAAELPVLHGEIDGTGPVAAGRLAPSGPLDDGAATGDSNLDDVVEDPVDRLRQLIENRQDETVDILRGWMERDGETA